jgi:outer membrane protein assembly factor BamB
VNGGGQFPGIAFGTRFARGGHVGVLRPTGNAGTDNRHGGLICQYNPDQSVESSPAVGTFLPGGEWGIAVGTGDIFPGARDSGDVLVLGPHCQLVWARKLDGLTQSSPALADILGNGTLSVIEGTDNQRGGGSVWALNAQNGHVLWHTPVRGEVMGGCVTADLGGGYQDVIVATTGGAFVLDGRSGALLATLETGVGLQNSALVTDDPDGWTGVTLAGYNGFNHGVVEHYELIGSRGYLADEPGSWPMFHHDSTLSGNADFASGGEVPPAK